jgi:hypothetical protein
VRVLGLAANGNTNGSGCGNCTNYIELGGTPYGNLWSGSGTPANYFDVVAVAPYFGYILPDSWGADASGLTRAFTEMNSGGALPTGSGANTTTNSGNNYTLTSSSLCGNGGLSSPTNEVVTCLKFNATNTDNATLAVDGGTAYPLYYPIGNSSTIYQYQLQSGQVTQGETVDASFTTRTAAPAWSPTTTYSQNNFVSGSDGNTYLSNGNSNLNHDPINDSISCPGSSTNWTCITPAWWITGATGASGGMISSAVSSIVTATLNTLTALGVTLPLVSYEFGTSMVAIADPLQTIFIDSINADSRMTAAYISFLNQTKSAGLTAVQNHYYDIGAWNIFGTWGMKQNTYDVPSAKQNGIYTWITSNPRTQLPFLFNRDLPGHPANDDRPVGLNKAA